jgi:hypothetical protein
MKVTYWSGDQCLDKSEINDKKRIILFFSLLTPIP